MGIGACVGTVTGRQAWSAAATSGSSISALSCSCWDSTKLAWRASVEKSEA
jgi:hypothetical protein